MSMHPYNKAGLRCSSVVLFATTIQRWSSRID